MAKKEKAAAKKSEPAAKKSTATAVGSRVKVKKAGKDKPHREGKAKWQGNNSYTDDLATELAALGLRIKEITGDGNCFFRALGDQLEGNEGMHATLRQRIMSYITEHEEDFAPFVEDDEAFGTYVARMKKDGVWAGYMEVVAASSCLGANLTIYQAGQPRWRVINHPEDKAPMLHLSYHDGQHYNSVRCGDDFGSGPPVLVVIRGDGTVAKQPQRSAGDGSWDERDEKRVAASTACTDMALVHRALEKAGGDVEAAIEAVIEALASAPDDVEPEAAASEVTAGTASVSLAPAAAAAGADREAVPSGSAPTGSMEPSSADPNGPRVALGRQSPVGSSMADPCGSRGTAAGRQGREGVVTVGDGAAPAAAAASAAAPAANVPGTGVSTAGSGRLEAGEEAEETGSPRTAAAAAGASSSMTDAVVPAAAAGGHGVEQGTGDGATTPTSSTAPPTAPPPSGASLAAVEAESKPGVAASPATGADSGAGARTGTGGAGQSRTAAASTATSRKKPERRKVGIAVKGGGPPLSNNKHCPCGSNKKYKACCGPAAAAAERRRAAAGGEEAAAAAAGAAAAKGQSSETVVVAQVAALVI